jgi:pimeloyl-ACP methyl ester carboxylesterase
VLIGHSWGSALGLLYARDHPQKVAAFIGVAQVVSELDGQRAQYAFVAEEARVRNDSRAQVELTEIGAPPYSAARVLRIQALVDRFGGYFHTRPSDVGATLTGIARGYVTPWEIARIIRANNVSLEAMNAELLTLDLRRSVPAVEVPVVFMLGRHDRQVDARIASAYFDQLRAPRKTLIWFERSAHNVPFEEPDAFNARVAQTLNDLGVRLHR